MEKSSDNITTEQALSDATMAPGLSKALLISYIGNSILNVLFTLTATFGNIVIAISLRKIHTLHAPSKALYISLCLSDLGVGTIAHPLYIGYLVTAMKEHSRDMHGAIYDIHNVMSVFLCAISLLTMTAITADRLLALRLKLRYRETVTLRKVTVALVFSYGISAFFSSAYFWDYNLYLYATYSGVLVCALVSSVCCILVYITIHRQRKMRVFNKRRAQSRELELNTKDWDFNMVTYRRSFFSTLYMYGSLSICYLPYVCLKIAGGINGWDQDLSAAFYWCGTLVLFNSSLNPLLYCWRIQGIRQAVKETVKSFFPFIKFERRVEPTRPSSF